MSEPRPGWWSRNWKWFVPVGCLTMVLLFVLFIVAIVFGVFGMMKKSDVYAQAMQQARANPEVAEALGTPFEEGLFVSGNFNETGPSGTAALSIPLKGPKGDGTLYVEANKSTGVWTFSSLVLEAPDASRIDLLAADADNGPVDDAVSVPDEEFPPEDEVEVDEAPEQE